MRRVAFLFDGFNLYHSLCIARRDLGGRGTLWLDLMGLSRGLLPLVGGNALLEAVYYFSALAGHADQVKPGATGRQLTYMDALRASGVVIELGHFKARRWTCSACGKHGRKFEEKETDVAIAVRLLDLL
jgi:hypothetical protein